MRKIAISISLLLVIITCKGQEVKQQSNITTKKKDNMEYFNIENYTNLPINPYTGLGIMPNGDEVQYFKGNNNIDYIIRIKKKDSPITVIKIFFEKSKSLKFLGNEFHDLRIGIDREYDENGRTIKETDNDKDYKVSIEDLTKKMKEEYKIDLLSTKQIHSVSRNNNEYLIICDQQARNTFYNYVIDGTTGETLSIKIIDGESEYEKVILDRKAEKKKTEEDDNIYFTTYKGKDYTKGEWKAFEEEWYKNHQDKKNSKGFWDDIFKRP